MAKRRKRGDGSIHLRKDGRWEGRIVVGRDAKGLPVTKNVLAKTKAECVAKLESCGRMSEPPPPSRPSLGSPWAAGWITGTRPIKRQTSAPIPRCPMSGASISTLYPH